MKLIRRLQALQRERGHLDDAALAELAVELGVPLYRLEGLVSFYPAFRRTPGPGVVVSVCRDASCALRGGEAAAAALAEALDGDDAIVLERSSCVGACDAAPAALVRHLAVRADNVAAVRAVAEGQAAAASALPGPLGTPWRLDPYGDSEERYLAVEKLRAGGDEAVDRLLGDLRDAGLQGMGGAGFPTARKWSLVRAEKAETKYVICNADESEPGTFKDRVVMEHHPYLVIEGMALAAAVVRARHGIIYIRHEYERARRELEREIARARQAGVLGDEAGFDVEIFVSPGGYILGEETALLEALEDKRGEPRNKPPYPGTHGLRGKPTLINNVETLAWTPLILLRGAQWWRAQGVAGHAGLKLIAVSGHVERPGVYEVPVGTTVRTLIDRAGGVLAGRELLAFAPGGASSNFLAAADADVAIDFNALRDAGSMLGSGALLVVAAGTDLLDLATNITRFFRNESCGKCVPCRLGTEKGVALLEGMRRGEAREATAQRLQELDETLAQTSICGLGQVALGPALSVLGRFFGEEKP